MRTNQPSQNQPLFLPMSRKEMDALGWTELDVLLVSGDAYVDHPSFGAALLGRWLVAHGFRVGVVAQPEWLNPAAGVARLQEMGRPRLFAGVAAGALDSMLAHYTAFRKKRGDDAYTPGGRAGLRPNRAVIAYTGMVRQAFKDCPVVIGGIEASLRRVSHYDFWSDSLRRSILLDSKADILVYGMGERALLSLARLAAGLEAEGRLARGALAEAAREVAGTGTVYTADAEEEAGRLRARGQEVMLLPGHEDISARPELLLAATLDLEKQVHQAKAVVLQQSGPRLVHLTPPAPPLATEELDALYGLSYSRLPHPAYTEPVPAWEMIRASITSHRGCAGGCSFCSLALHQGRRIASRSRRSILDEAAHIAQGPKAAGQEKKSPPKWAGSISDVGGPSANMWQARCAVDPAGCVRSSCLHPKVCPHFKADQKKNVALLREVAGQPGVRHVRVASGVRFDLALLEDEALRAYTQEFTGGQLKVAPEHCSPEVLALMRKPDLPVFEAFLRAFADQCRAAGKEQYVVPYLMSAFPGCTDKHMEELKGWLEKRGWSPEQVQCFIPTPGTLATAMFYSGRDVKGQPLHVARTDAERLRQHGILTGQRPGGRPGRDQQGLGAGRGHPGRRRQRGRHESRG